jgi:NAD(P)-dependent dehydrogenase (short-subunit alcohol dehydrogenase family)
MLAICVVKIANYYALHENPMAEAHIDFTGRVALVTGGTRGIGRGIAAAFLAAGAQVVVCARRPGERLVVAGRAAEFRECDVRDADAAAALVHAVAHEYGRFDVLVNNAGGGPPVESARAPTSLSEKLVQLNLLAPFYLSQAAHAVMTQQADGGSIVNIASVSAVRSSPYSAIYGASKAGLLNLTESLAMEWGPKIRVNAIIAGLVATENAREHYGGDEGIARISAMLPLKRMGTPDDIANACLFLASPLAAYISGAQLAVHGGGETPVFLDLAKPRT